MRRLLWLLGVLVLLTACLFAVNAVIAGSRGEIGWAVLMGAIAIALTFGGHWLRAQGTSTAVAY